MSTVSILRDLCTNCRTSPTSKNVCGTPFEARQLDRTQSVAARYGMLETAQVIEEGLAVIVPDALDGREWKWEEVLPAMVQSRATGGLSKFECGFDPSTFKRKHKRKVQKTERLYIHHEECMLNYIGSTLQENSRSTAPVYLRNSDSLIEVGMNQAFVVDLMLNDMRAMARAIDGNVILGNWAGDNSDTSSITVPSGSYAQMFPHFDGIIKQTLLQADNTYYPSVDVTLPAIAGSNAYFLKWKGTWQGAFADIDELLAGINALTIDVTGTMPYSAVEITEDVLIRITGSDPEAHVYSEDALQIYWSEDGTVNACTESLTATVVQNPMPYAEEPILFEYDAITSVNFYEYFKNVIREVRRKMALLFENNTDSVMVLRNQYIAIDPLLYIEKDFALLQELCGCDNGDQKVGILDNMFPKFVPVKVLEGTGLWYWSTQDNILVLTNAEDPMLPNIEVWHDKDCDMVKGRNEMLANVLVADYALVATNALNSPFHNALTDPYQPENLPHLHDDCAQNTVCGSTDGARAIAYACYTLEEDDSYTLTLNSESIIPSGKTVSDYEWKVWISGVASEPASQAKDVEVAVSAVNFPNLNLVSLKITLSDGSVYETTVPASEIAEC